ncbi:MAG: endonuclease/exonuclease/phosphatase family protein [Treponema sp.]|nr:endonuclease/exonuclease/phosphatase family protein [Treponema sp.]
MKRIEFILMPLLLLSSCACVAPGKGSGFFTDTQSIKVLDWNLETFFDANFDGDEYAEFSKSSAGWSLQKYDQRLERLAQVIKSVDADVIIMQELEKREQLYDIFNRVCSNFKISKNYSYGTFCRHSDSAIGCAVLSRFPIKRVLTHSIDCKSRGVQPPMRPLMEVILSVGEKEITVLVNHWKSKSGGSEKSEFWRNQQESLLARQFCCAVEEDRKVFACGDFNRNLNEFKTIKNDSGLIDIELRGRKNVLVQSPWYDIYGNMYPVGSYWYRGAWERIDHYFAPRGTVISDFKVERGGPWASESGTPVRYYLRDGTGYSDHFPISCSISF